MAEEKLLAHLILVMLERSGLLLAIPMYSREIHRYDRRRARQAPSPFPRLRFPASSFSPRLSLPSCRVFSCHLLRLCKLRPSLVVDQSHELLEFAGTTANVYSKEEVYTHVVKKKRTVLVLIKKNFPIMFFLRKKALNIATKLLSWQQSSVEVDIYFIVYLFLKWSCDSLDLLSEKFKNNDNLKNLSVLSE